MKTLYGVMTLFTSDIPGNSEFDTTLSQADFARSWLDKAAEVGSQVIRFPADWIGLQPTSRDAVDQGYLGELIATIFYAKGLGMEVIFEFGQTPEWARMTGRESDAFTPPANPDDYANAVSIIHQAFQRAGIDDAIAAYEIGNENNLEQFWTGGQLRNDLSGTPFDQETDGSVTRAEALIHVDILNASYDALKALDPAVKVLGGSLGGTDATYLEWMLEAGAKMDGLAVHPYTRNFNGTDAKPARPGESPLGFGDDLAEVGLPRDLNERFSFEFGLKKLVDILDAAGRSDVNLWITEMGWSIEDFDDGDPNDDFLVVADQQEQAAYIAEGFDILNALGRVDAVTLFQLYDALDGDFGIVNADGSPRPAANVLQQQIAAQEQADAPVDDPAAPVADDMTDSAADPVTDDMLEAPVTVLGPVPTEDNAPVDPVEPVAPNVPLPGFALVTVLGPVGFDPQPDPADPANPVEPTEPNVPLAPGFAPVTILGPVPTIIPDEPVAGEAPVTVLGPIGNTISDFIDFDAIFAPVTPLGPIEDPASQTDPVV